MGPAAERAARQQRVQANVPAVQRSQAVRQAAEFRQQSPGISSDAGVQRPPRIYNPQGGGVARPTRVFTPNPTVTAPPTVQEPQPTPAVVSPTITGTVDPATRTWNGRGGVRGDRGDWRNRGGIEGNQDWRTRRGDGSGNWRNNNDGNADWRNDHDGERRRNWRNGAGRRGEWHANRHNFRRHDWSRQHRSRDWWRSRYSRFARFGSGYYYWNSGYWYPAYGYNPYFSTYTYDAPLYAYNDQDPGEIIASVQQELQRLGYYRGSLDGTYGPMTRRALLNYQRDNGLPVTGEIDQDTLASLGFE